MLIFIIPTSYPDKTNPVRDIFIYEQAKALAAAGNKIVVLHIEKQPTKDIFSKINRSITRYDDGFAIRYAIQQKTFVEKYAPMLNKNRFIRDMEMLYRHAIEIEGKPDILYAHFSCWAGFAAQIISKKYKIPLVTIEHYSGFLKGRINRQCLQGLKTVVENSDKMLSVSVSLQNALTYHTKTKKDITVLPNMIDECFTYHERIENDSFTFLSIGNLNKRKRFTLLVEAFCMAFSNEERVFLRICGAGEEYSVLRQLISAHGREKQITLVGRVNRSETLSEYINSNCFVLPSASETFGIVYREAMAVGRPVITTDHGGFSQDDWSDEFGIMIPVDDKDSLIKAFQYMYANYTKYNCREISVKCLNKHSSVKITESLMDILTYAKFNFELKKNKS